MANNSFFYRFSLKFYFIMHYELCIMNYFTIFATKLILNKQL
jgi:hypothetical protein